ncbi:acyltransferase family protein [Luteimonas sp. MC1828]|uniref:acyltransferase family protein n=1 Tax=Luteimonas sp. MC1828 TaxID=2799787 RepID=UPI0018F1D185|nr:acyltransferase family protein [Luteimonas sp. MC1828]MBJ7575238.1 acyltransferase [Luteimonas sp. MC1828]
MAAGAGLRPAPGYRADVDGLRAIAVLAVVAYHAFPRLLPGGFVGVDVFFVISGFLITGILRDGLAAGTFGFAGFYVRRIRRLFPALVVVLAACLVAGWWLLVPADYAALGRHAAASAGFIANLAFWHDTDYFAAAAETLPLLHLWSLGVEEQFYLLWPPLLALAITRGADTRRLVLVVGVLSLAYCLWLTARDASAAFYLPFTRFWELLAGAWLAHRLGSTVAPAASGRTRITAELAAFSGLALIIAACVGLSDQSPFPGWRALLPVAGTALLIAAVPATGWAQRLLSLRALVWIGLVSYPLYLWHWPLLSFARIHATGEVAPGLRVALVVLAVVLAGLTWWLVERPLRHRMHARRALAVLLPAMALVLAAGLALWALQGVASRAGEPVRQYANYGYDWRAPSREGTCSLVGAPGEPAEFPAECVDAQTAPPRPLLVLWGDSHSALLYPGMREVADGRLRLAQFTRSGCRPYLDPGKEPCRSDNARVLQRIAALRPDYVLLFAYWNGREYQDPAQVLRDLEPGIAALHAAGVGQVVVLGPAPRWRAWLPALLVQRHARQPFLQVPQRLRGETLPEVHALDAALRRALGGRDDVTYVSALSALCDLRGCLTYVDDPAELTTWDYGHLGPRASALVASTVLEALETPRRP